MSLKQESQVNELQSQLTEAEKDLTVRQLLWEATEEWKQMHSQWSNTVFSSLDIVALQKEVARFVQTIYLLEKGKLYFYHAYNLYILPSFVF